MPQKREVEEQTKQSRCMVITLSDPPQHSKAVLHRNHCVLQAVGMHLQCKICGMIGQWWQRTMA